MGILGRTLPSLTLASSALRFCYSGGVRGSDDKATNISYPYFYVPRETLHMQPILLTTWRIKVSFIAKIIYNALVRLKMLAGLFLATKQTSSHS
jgi:hypothetical protein